MWARWRCRDPVVTSYQALRKKPQSSFLRKCSAKKLKSNIKVWEGGKKQIDSALTLPEIWIHVDGEVDG